MQTQNLPGLPDARASDDDLVAIFDPQNGSHYSETIRRLLGRARLGLNTQSANYELVAADANGCIYHPATDATPRTWTIPSNANTPFPVGTAVTFDNDFGAGALTIAIAGDTLIHVGTAAASGNWTVPSGGQATALKVTATRWRIGGTA